MNPSRSLEKIDLSIEVLDHRIEFLAAAAGTCSTTSCSSSTTEQPNESVE